jgi:uncharacterized membrane protein YgdD (TMEM256/DUF423 family)
MQPANNNLPPGQISNRYRPLIIVAALLGATGVGAAAAASHGESRHLSAIAAICLSHGPALLALGLAGWGRLFWWSTILLAGGTIVFVLDLGVREWLGHGLFTGAAPLGGLLMILGWLTLAVAALVGTQRAK